MAVLPWYRHGDSGVGKQAGSIICLGLIGVERGGVNYGVMTSKLMAGYMGKCGLYIVSGRWECWRARGGRERACLKCIQMHHRPTVRFYIQRGRLKS
jgi:hypothetical protein